MSQTKTKYADILKATTIFGGVQVFNILVSIFKTKFVAYTVGPLGVGLLAIFTSVLNMSYGILGTGFELVGLKYIQNTEISTIKATSYFVLKRVIISIGILISIIIICLANFLSTTTFGNKLYVMSFTLLSIAVFFKYVASLNLIVLQSLQKIKLLALTNILGNLLGLIISLPLFYYFKFDAIIPSIIISVLTSLFFSTFFLSKFITKNFNPTNKIFLHESKSLITNSAIYSISSALPLVTSYLIFVYIQKIGGVIDVGYCNVGFSILNVYVGTLFSAMSTDYFPRLNAIKEDNVAICFNVNQQATLGILLITPIIVFVFIFSEQIINTLFSNEFVASNDMVKFGIIGMLFKVVSFSLGYVLLVKAQSKLFIKTSIVFNLLYLLICTISYKYFGFLGLGCGFTLHYLIHLTSLIIITKLKYGINFNKEVKTFFLIASIFILICFTLKFITNINVRLFFSLLLLFISCFVSFKKIYAIGGFNFLKVVKNGSL